MASDFAQLFQRSNMCALGRADFLNASPLITGPRGSHLERRIRSVFAYQQIRNTKK